MVLFGFLFLILELVRKTAELTLLNITQTLFSRSKIQVTDDFSRSSMEGNVCVFIVYLRKFSNFALFTVFKYFCDKLEVLTKPPSELVVIFDVIKAVIELQGITLLQHKDTHEIILQELLLSLLQVLFVSIFNIREYVQNHLE